MTMKWPRLLAGFLLWTAVATTACAATRESTSLQTDMQQLLREERWEGVVWSTVAADGSVISGAAGVSDARSRAPMLASSRVHVGSVTKAVLAVGVLHLVSSGRLSLDAPVSEVVPSIRFDNPWETTHPVRVRHLLEHTAGLENLKLSQFFSLQATADTPLATGSGTDAGALPVLNRPGSRFSYSNLGYTLLGQVIEAVTAERYETWMNREVLAPLAMHDSTFAFTAQSGPSADARLAMGHFEQAHPAPAVPTYLRPAAQLTTTAADMARFAAFLLGDGTVHAQPFISPELMAAITRPGDTEAARAGLPLGHGLVLVGRDRHGVVGACHPGNTVGFWAMLCVFPQHRSAFFVATNTDNEDADNERLNRRLIDALALPKAAPTRASQPLEHSPHDWSGFYVRAPAPMPAIAPLQALTDFIRVDRSGNTLRLRTLSKEAQLLQPMGGNLFRADGRTLPSHALLIGDDGKRVLSDGLRSHVRVPKWQIALPALLLAIACAALVILLVLGFALALRRRLHWRHPAFAPLLACTALLLPWPFFLQQSLLRLGDRTVASSLLALVTLALPLALLAGVALGLRQWRDGSRSIRAATLCIAMSLPGVLLLVAWGLLPLRLWSL
ncbi:serine hydrolase domain-containing protein [Stenotrophomonas sp. SY1]|uniref:serine hydrolase domain-containing protein n=1 Tax=Stenotrophomonas sp. SY1 TaxID=477235 RepID=UPI001E4938E3|nr:serine hydrolase domain-containing protein [Stenotrophomonas sp. SY1]MCD9088041.1 beta-lactamase family protein [Stenotrophomonas sp. SY1]